MASETKRGIGGSEEYKVVVRQAYHCGCCLGEVEKGAATCRHCGALLKGSREMVRPVGHAPEVSQQKG